MMIIIFLCIMAILMFLLMAGSEKQTDRNNFTMAFCVVILAIIIIYTK